MTEEPGANCTVSLVTGTGKRKAAVELDSDGELASFCGAAFDYLFQLLSKF
jgi:hypothetical protein